MDDTCWICGFKIKPQEFEDIVYTKAGIAHGYCLELFPFEMEVRDEKDLLLR